MLETTPAVVYVLQVQMHDNDYGNRKMDIIASAILNGTEYDHYRGQLHVQVLEHGGWSMTYALIDGEPSVLSSANEHGVAPNKTREYLDSIYTVRREYLPRVHWKKLS